MAAVRALAQVLYRVVIAIVGAVAVAAVLAVIHGGTFRHALAVSCWATGALLLLMGAVGHTTASRTLETGGRMPGLPATFRSRPGDTSLSTSAVFFLAAATLFVLGAVLS